MTTAEEPVYHDLKIPSAASIQKILVIAQALHHDTQQPMPHCLYEVVKEFVKQTLSAADKKDLFQIIFSHYIEAYRAYKYTDAIMNGGGDTINAVLLHNEATISVLALYEEYHRDVIMRRLVVQAVNAMHQVAVAYHSFGAEKDIKVSIVDLGNIALITQTLAYYVKGRNLVANIPYVKYLKKFFETMLNDPDLTFVQDDKVYASVIKQLTAKAKVIKI